MDTRQHRIPDFRALIAAAGLLLITPAQAAEQKPHEFEADYALEIYSTTAARATYTLKHTPEGLVMTQSTRPAGIISLLRDDKLDVRSTMRLQDGEIYLQAYDYTHTGTDENRNSRFRIEWDHAQEPSVGSITGTDEGRPFELVTSGPVWDPLSIQVPLMLHAGKNMPPHDHAMLLNDEIRHYTVTRAGTETIEIDYVRYDTVKLVGREKTRDRAMTFWLAPELHYLPVRTEQWKDGKLKSTVYLTGARFPQQDAAADESQPND